MKRLRADLAALGLGLAVAALVGLVTAGAETGFGGVVYTWPSAHGTAGKLLATDGAKTLSWTGTAGTPSVPSGIVMFVAGDCPAGWANLGSATGRYVVGTPLGGTTTGTAGTALSYGENRATGTHTHTTSASLTIGTAEHTHSITDPGHRHDGEDDYGGNYAVHGSGGDYAGKLRFESGYGHQLTSQTTGVTLSNTDTDVSVASSGATVGNGGSSVAGTNAPYVQLRACEKS